MFLLFKANSFILFKPDQNQHVYQSLNGDGERERERRSFKLYIVFKHVQIVNAILIIDKE